MKFALHQSGERRHAECPRSWYATAISMVKVEGFEPFERGRLVHEVIESCLLAHGRGVTDLWGVAEEILGRHEGVAAISPAALADGGHAFQASF